MSTEVMEKVFRTVGWSLILLGLAGSPVTYVIVSRQEFVLAVLARLVESPFQYRVYIALFAAGAVLVVGCLLGLLYVGISKILEERREAH